MNRLLSALVPAGLLGAALLLHAPVESAGFSDWNLLEPRLVVRDGGPLGGVTYDPSSDRLVVLSDLGRVEAWSLDGTRVRTAELPGAPALGGACYDEQSGRILAVSESDARVYILDPRDLDLVSSFELEGLPRTRRGIQSMNIVPTPTGRELWVGHRGVDMVFAYELNGSLPVAGPIARALPLDAELVGLGYDPVEERVVAADAGRILAELGDDGRVRGSVAWDGGPERVAGVTFDERGNLYLAVTGVGLLRYDRVEQRNADAGPENVVLATAAID